MKFLKEKIRYIYVQNKHNKYWRVTATFLAAVIVFVTTYSLILPAITMELELVSEMPGVYLEDMEEFPESQSGTADLLSDGSDIIPETYDDSLPYYGQNPGNDSFDVISGEEEVPGAEKLTVNDENVEAEVYFTSGARFPAGMKLVYKELETEETQYSTLCSIAQESADQIEEENISWSDCDVRIFELGFTNADGYYEIPAGEMGIEFRLLHPMHVDQYRLILLKDERGSLSADPAYIDCDTIVASPNDTLEVEINENGEVTGFRFRAEAIRFIALLTKNDEVAEAAATDQEASAADSEPDFETEMPEPGISDAEGTDAETIDAGNDDLQKTNSEGELALLYPAQIFDAYTDTVTVHVEAEAGAFPANTIMTVEDIENEETLSAIEGAVEQSVAKVHAVEITFCDAEGNEIEPLTPVKVVMTAEESAASEEVKIVHVDDEGVAAQVEDASLVEENGEIQAEVIKEGTPEEEAFVEASFDAEQFSIYALVYTVDFHWEVNGKSYQYSLPGGGFVSLTALVEALRIMDDSNSGENEAETEAVDETSDFAAGDTVKWFVADVESMMFSNPEFVWVGKADADTTVRALKETNGVECEYSAELTEEQIAVINDTEVRAGDWAMISRKPFVSEEMLTVTMKDGEVFTIRVTDAQISTHVITAEGERFRITVTYGEEAGIPEGSVLAAEEIPEGSEKYEKYLEETAEKWEEADREGYISFARFFDIEIRKDGTKIEPEAPVEVEIVHDDGLAFFENESLSVIHFAENGAEIIDEIHRNETGTEIIYEQNGFSVIGTVSTVKDSGWPTANGQYVLVLQDGDDYYALKQDGTLTKIRYFNNTVSFIGEGTTTTDYINDYLWYVVSSGNRGKISDEYAEYNAAPDGQTFIDPYSSEILSGTSRQLQIRDGKIFCSGQLPGSSSYTQVALSASGGQLSRVALTSEDASPVFFSSVSSFTANDNETDLFTQIEVESIIDKWREQKIHKADYDKTAEVYDYENRIYQVDITASSSDYEVAPSIALEFVVDASRSMFYPTKIEECGTLTANSNTALKNWLETNGDINKTYFVVNNPNTDATQIALFYNPAETKHWYRDGGWKYYEGAPYGVWEWTDASNYNPPDGGKAIGNVLDRWSYGNLDLKVYETDMLSYSYEQDYGIRGQYVSRIEYLKQCVRVASQVIYAVDDKAQIGLVGFNRYITDYGTYGKDEQETLLNQLDNINLDGGTNQEGGLAEAVSKFQNPENRDKYAGRKHVVVLVTDGAPNYTYTGGHQVTWDTIGSVADQLKSLQDDFGDDTELYTMGLSLSNVGTNQSGLFGIASGSGYQYAAEDAAQIINAVTKMVDGIFIQANLMADVTDVIDPAFYPVNRADGLPLAENDWISLNGRKVNAGATDAAGQIKKDPSTGNWYVEWKNQRIDWPTTDSHGAVTDPGWHGTVFVKAKEDFLGGNGINTNAKGSRLEAKQFIVRGESSLRDLPEGDHTTVFETPCVNVDELDITKNDTDWTVYLGTGVDPLKELKALWEKVKIKEVVTKTDSDHRISSDGRMTYQYAANTNDNRAEAAGREELSFTDLGITLTDDDWEDMIAGQSKIFEYSAYDHSSVGTIMISLTQEVKAGEKNLTESPHDTTVTGSEVEKYTLTVSYRPRGANVSNWHVGSYGSGMSGSRAGNFIRDNTHIVNVYVKGLQITKVDLNDRVLPGAKFALYRTARDGETDLLEINEGTYYKLAELDTSATGIAVKDQIEQLKEGEQYYLVETQVPDGYNSISPIPVTMSISNVYIPKPGTAEQTTKPESGIYDWEQKTALILDAGGGVKRTNADNTVDLTHSGTGNSDNEILYYRIINNPGVELPATGGSGTTMFYLLGSLFILCAGLILGFRFRDLAGLLVLVLCITLTPAGVRADEMPDLSMNGKSSISITFRDKKTDQPIPGGTLELIQVASVMVDNGFVFVPSGAFAAEDFTFDLSEKADLSQPSLAENINTYVENHFAAIKGVSKAIGTSGEETGKAAFTGLNLGLYLIRETQAAEGYSRIRPFLVTIPQKSEKGYIYQVDASPKPEKGSKLPGITTDCPVVSKTVTTADGSTDGIPKNDKFTFVFKRLDKTSPKVVNSSGAVSAGGSVVSQTEDAITLQLTGPGQLKIGTITFDKAGEYFYQLSEQKGSDSHYTYDDTAYWIKYVVAENTAGDGLQIKETVVRVGDATGEIVKEISPLKFVNQYKPGVTPSPGGGSGSSTGGGRLPQTGQLWWPVWVLCAAGIVLMILGVILAGDSE